MKRSLNSFSLISIFVVLLSVTAAVKAQNVTYSVSDRQVQALINGIETRTNTFRNEIARSLDQGVYNGARRQESLTSLVANFETSTDRLRDNFASRRSTTADVQDV